MQLELNELDQRLKVVVYVLSFLHRSLGHQMLGKQETSLC